MAKLTNLKLENWRQFGNLDIQFSPNLTILTGANGSGKTTILKILSIAFGWNVQFASNQIKGKENGEYLFTPDIDERKSAERDFQIGICRVQFNALHSKKFPIHVGFNNQWVYGISNWMAGDQDSKWGIYIPAQRPSFITKPVESLPSTPPTIENIRRVYLEAYKVAVAGNQKGTDSINLSIKRELISLSIFGAGNEFIEKNDFLYNLFLGFQELLSKLFPAEIGFKKFEILSNNVLLVTKTGTFPLDASSGGMASLIDLAWQLHIASFGEEEFIVLIDEPETHLHPKLQREILPKLLELFPNFQFIVATHNPFIISSIPDSNLYWLDFGEDGKVSAQLRDNKAKAGSVDEILRNLLGVEMPEPLWVEKQLSEIVGRYSGLPEEEFDLLKLKNEMEEIGFGDVFPETVTRVIRGRENEKTN